MHTPIEPTFPASTQSKPLDPAFEVLSETNGPWLAWVPGSKVPTGTVDVKLHGGGICIGVDAIKLRWGRDFGLTPTSIIAYKIAGKFQSYAAAGISLSPLDEAIARLKGLIVPPVVVTKEQAVELWNIYKKAWDTRAEYQNTKYQVS